MLIAVYLENWPGNLVALDYLFCTLQSEDLENFFYPGFLHLRRKVLDSASAQLLLSDGGINWTPDWLETDIGLSTSTHDTETEHMRLQDV